jgi:hypothetical protein
MSRATSQIANSQVSVPANTATQVAAACSGRAKLYLYVSGDMFVGADSTVDDTTGFSYSQLTDAGTGRVVLETQAAVWVFSTNARTVSVLELFN